MGGMILFVSRGELTLHGDSTKISKNLRPTEVGARMGPKRFGSSASVSGACCKDGATCVSCWVLGLASLRTRRVWKPVFDKTCKHEWKQNSTFEYTCFALRWAESFLIFWRSRRGELALHGLQKVPYLRSNRRSGERCF